MGDPLPLEEIKNRLPSIVFVGAGWCYPCKTNLEVLAGYAEGRILTSGVNRLNIGGKPYDVNILYLKLDDKTPNGNRTMGEIVQEVIFGEGWNLPLVFVLNSDRRITAMGQMIFDVVDLRYTLHPDFLAAMETIGK